jgi:hypothetical protein
MRCMLQPDIFGRGKHQSHQMHRRRSPIVLRKLRSHMPARLHQFPLKKKMLIHEPLYEWRRKGGLLDDVYTKRAYSY